MKILNLSLMVDTTTPNGYQKAMKSVCHEYAELNCGDVNFNEKAINLAEGMKPDIIFIQIQQSNVLALETASILSKIGFVINWTGDIRIDTPQWMIDIGKVIQLTSFSNMRDVNNCRKLGIRSDYLEIGFDPTLYKRHKIEIETPEIVAHFNDYGSEFFPLSKYREDIVHALREEFGGRFGVFGNIKGASKNFNSNQIEESINYNNSKIAINCSHFNCDRYSSDRLLRILGSGTFCLSHEYIGIDKNYKVGTHLATFENIDDLIYKCKFYLLNKTIRERMSNFGYDFANANFTFKNMALNIIELYKKHNGR